VQENLFIFFIFLFAGMIKPSIFAGRLRNVQDGTPCGVLYKIARKQAGKWHAGMNWSRKEIKNVTSQ